MWLVHRGYAIQEKSAMLSCNGMYVILYVISLYAK